MIIDDLKDRFLEVLQATKSRVEETDAYMQLKERYDSLNPIAQKLVLGSVGLIVVFILIQVPMTYYSAGSENLALFDENRDLTLDLYRAKRRGALAPMAPTPLSTSDIESRSRSALASARIPPEQIKSISVFDNKTHNPSAFISSGVEQKGIEVQLANLNVSQIMEIGHSLLASSDSIRMVGLEIKPGAHTGSYFDTTYRLVSFATTGKKP